MGKSIFWKSVIYGALVGGALSLLDRSTRQSAISCAKKTTAQVSYYAKNPNEAVNQVKEVTERIKTTAQQVTADAAFIVETVEELKEAAPKVAGMVQDTKDAFSQESKSEKNHTVHSNGPTEV